MRTMRALAVASGALTLVVAVPVTAQARLAPDPHTPPDRENPPRVLPDAERPIPIPDVRNLGGRPVPMPRVQPRGAVVPMPEVGEPQTGVLLVPDPVPR